MEVVKLITAFFASLPELIQLVKEIQKAIDKAEIDGKVKDNVGAIHTAFAAKDASKLNAIFKSQ